MIRWLDSLGIPGISPWEKRGLKDEAVQRRPYWKLEIIELKCTVE